MDHAQFAHQVAGRHEAHAQLQASCTARGLRLCFLGPRLAHGQQGGVGTLIKTFQQGRNRAT